MKTKITVCRSAGFCFGVGRAVDMALRDGRALYSVGPLVHNERVLEALRAGGVHDVERLEDIPEEAAVLIRSHGAGRELTQALAGRTVLDATCPCVARIHEIVRQESAEGRRILIFGNPEHPEVTATASWCGWARIFRSRTELEQLAREHLDWLNMPFTVVAQTTALATEWIESSNFLKKVYTNVKILDTICQATNMRQREAAALSKTVDLMLVLGDRKSSNTRHLAEVCQNAVLLQTAQELDMSLLPIGGHIGITAGASTPASIIEEVVETMTEEMKKAEQAAEAELGQAAESINGDGESFAELLESSLKTLMNGDKVIGIITGITPTEIQVDLGTKHAGYVPVDELSDDPSENAAAALKIGDEIETFVVRVNDVEGTAMLSKKRLETVKSWETVETAQDSGVILEGIVTEENKGGIVVSVKGVRVFVPASQTGLPKDAPMSDMLKRKVRLRITEFNRARRRVVGSIRAVSQEERRAASEAIWGAIEEGKVYQGTVKSLTSYGAFVDIGGIDGMVHVSELSWSRINQPGDILKIGDPIEVFVLSFDREKKKISLGHRKLEDNPWNKFITQYKIGDVLEARVVKLMTFGAFCEVIPGVDGLVHISQLADRRVEKPADVVSEGDTVTVKLIDVDYDRKKISLSIRALIEQGSEQPETYDESGDEVVASVGEAGGTAIASDLLEGGELDNIAEAVAEAAAEVAAEEALEEAAKSE